MQTITVEMVAQTSPMRALVVGMQTPLEMAIKQFAADENGRRAIFVVDNNGRLRGVVNNHDLLHWARLRLDVPHMEGSLAVGKVRRLMSAETIMDLAVPGSEKTAVPLDASLADTINKMARYNLEDIPVLDENGRVVNDLRLSEILSFVLRTSPETS